MMPVYCCFEQLHRWNALLCPCIGYVTNLGLVLLVLKRTPKELRVHSRILLQTCIVDLLLLTLVAIAQPVMSIQPNGIAVILFQENFFNFIRRESPAPVLAIFFCLWFLLHNFEVNGISVPFLYRFLVLNWFVRSLH